MSSSPVGLAGVVTPLLIVLGSCIGPAVAQPVALKSAPPITAPMVVAAGTASESAPARVTLTIDDVGAQQGSLLHGQVVPATATLTLDGAAITVADDGHFIIGFDRDAVGTRLLAASAGAATQERNITIAPRLWAIQNIDAAMRGGAASDADFERRRPAELAQMGAARRTIVTSEGWRQRFVWPVRGRISGVFGSQRVYRGVPSSFHNGVDVAVPSGTAYVAPADGVVILAATTPFTLEGYLLMVDHGMGLSSVFLHSSRLDVRTGDVVVQGQRLGAVGATGRATGPHMHWAMRWNGAKIDAAQVAGPMTR